MESDEKSDEIKDDSSENQIASESGENTVEDDNLTIDEQEILRVVDLDEYLEDNGLTNTETALPAGGSEMDVDSENSNNDNDESSVPFVSEITIIEYHSDDVLRIVCSPKQDIAVSGGQDDKSFLIEYASSPCKRIELPGQTDSVDQVCFSACGQYVATGDLGGVVQVFKLDGSSLWKFELGEDLCSLEFHPKASGILFGSTESGILNMWLVPSGQTKVFTKGGQCGKLCTIYVIPDGQMCLAGYENGTISMWTLRSGEEKQLDAATAGVAPEQTGSGEVLTIHANPEAVLALSGTRDGKARLHNLASGKIVNVWDCGAAHGSGGGDGGEAVENTVECCRFSPNSNQAAWCSIDGVITILDVISQRVRHSLSNGSAQIKCVWNPDKEGTLYTGGLCGTVTLWDTLGGLPLLVYGGDRSVEGAPALLDFSLSWDNKHILCARADSKISVFAAMQ